MDQFINYGNLSFWLSLLGLVVGLAVLWSVTFVIAPAVKNVEQLLLTATEPKPCCTGADADADDGDTTAEPGS